MILAAVASGCASQKVDADKPVVRPTTPQTQLGYLPAPAAALVYDVPGVELAALDLSRAGREQAAFAGYDVGGVSTYAVQVYDRQSTYDFGYGWNGDGVVDRYDRRTFITRTGTRLR